MSTLAHDAQPDATTVVPSLPGSRVTSGIAYAIASAVSFGMSGALARGLLDNHWSAGAVTWMRVALAALVLTPFGLAALRGRWQLLRRNARLIAAYGTFAVAGAQFCYFSAVQHMQVGPALLMEFMAPALVVVYLWLRHGQRPSRLTLIGAGVAAAGLVLVLNLLSGTDLSTIGVLWAMGAMVGCATHFIISADEGNGLPPIVLAWGGLVVAAVGLGLLGLVGVLPMHATSAATTYAGHAVPWWLPIMVLGVVTAAISYVTGIAAGRRLGSRLASFVGLLEVVSGVFWAWLLLAELPGAFQLVGGLLILAGVVAVKMGERSIVTAVHDPA